MKKEIHFYKDKRGNVSAKNIIQIFRELGYTDDQIKEEMKKIISDRNKDKKTC